MPWVGEVGAGGGSKEFKLREWQCNVEKKPELKSDPVYVGRGGREGKGGNPTSRKTLVLWNWRVWRRRCVERDEASSN